MKFLYCSLALAALLSCGEHSQNTENDEEYSSISAAANAAAAGVPVVGVASRLCLDVETGVLSPNAKLQIFGCHGKPNQNFQWSSSDELRVFNSTLCVEPADKNSVSGTRLLINTCDASRIQKWKFNGNGTITNLMTGLCMDVKGRETLDKTPVQAFTCNGQSNQAWTIPAALDSIDPSVPANPLATEIDCDSLNFSWKASTDNVGVVAYDIYHDGQLMTSVDGKSTSVSLKLVPGASWGLYVNARDAAGNISQASATVDIKAPFCDDDRQPPTPPRNLNGRISGTSVNLSWGASTDNVAVTNYVIYRNKTKVGSIAGSGTSFIDSGLKAGTYSYSVEARDAQDNVSAQSNVFSATVSQNCTQGVCSVTEVTTEKDLPWGLVSLPDGTILYSRRDAQDIIRLDPQSGVKTVIGKVPNVQGTDGEGGLMGLEIAPSFDQDRWLYIMHTSPSDNRIVRMKVTSQFKLDTGSLQILVQGIARNKFHDGGRLRWGPDNKLYASTGDGQKPESAQLVSGLNGKVLRLNPDGSVPSDNPFPKSYVWSYGHRNPQGLAFDSKGRLWEQEFGNSIMDETNLIVKGGNYGWPDCEGTSSQKGSGCATKGFIAPKRTYPTADGSCSGITVVRDVLYVACARGSRLYREVISGDSLTSVEQFFVGTYGRLRTVEGTRDGNLWLSTTNGGDKDSVANNSNNQIFKVILSQ